MADRKTERVKYVALVLKKGMLKEKKSGKAFKMIEKYNLFLEYLDKRIEMHNDRIDQCVKSGNQNMRTVCKAERAEADAIRNQFLHIYSQKEET